MKDKISKRHMTGFDRCARKLGVIGSIILLSSVTFGISLMVTLDQQNDALIQEVNRSTKIFDNLQLQYEDGNEWFVE